MVLCTEQIFKNSVQQKDRLSICFKTRSDFSKTFIYWAFEALSQNQKLEPINFGKEE